MIVDFRSYRISVSVTSFRVSNLSATVVRSYRPNIEKAQNTHGHRLLFPGKSQYQKKNLDLIVSASRSTLSRIAFYSFLPLQASTRFRRIKALVTRELSRGWQS